MGPTIPYRSHTSASSSSSKNFLIELLQSKKTAPTEPSPPSFTKFPELPSELRRQIWKHALPDPRVVQTHGVSLEAEIHYLHSNQRYQFNVAGCEHEHLKKLPKFTFKHCNNYIGKSHLLTCVEAAEVFKENYHGFSVAPRKGRPEWCFPVPRPAIEYLDPLRDTLILRLQDLTKLNWESFAPFLARVRHFALVGDFFGREQLGKRTAAWIKKFCPKLRTLIVVLTREFIESVELKPCGELCLFKIGLDFHNIKTFDPSRPEGGRGLRACWSQAEPEDCALRAQKEIMKVKEAFGEGWEDWGVDVEVSLLGHKLKTNPGDDTPGRWFPGKGLFLGEYASVFLPFLRRSVRWNRKQGGYLTIDQGSKE